MDFREFLVEELNRRQQKNPNFSQRAFARFLDVDSSRLSKMLRGERPIRNHQIKNFGLKLGLDNSEVLDFIDGFIQSKNTGKRTFKHYKQISEDHFQLIADWRHFAILEIIKLKTFKPDVKWVAEKLMTTPKVIEECLERLQRVNLLEITTKNEWQEPNGGFVTYDLGPDLTNQVNRQAQTQILLLAINALEKVPRAKRDQCSMMMASSKKKLRMAKIKIKKFRRELCEYLEQGDDKDEIFQLSISLLPLLKDETV